MRQMAPKSDRSQKWVRRLLASKENQKIHGVCLVAEFLSGDCTRMLIVNEQELSSLATLNNACVVQLREWL